MASGAAHLPVKDETPGRKGPGVSHTEEQYEQGGKRIKTTSLLIMTQVAN